MDGWEATTGIFDDDGLSHRPEFVNSVYYQTTAGDQLEGGYILTARGEVYERIRIHVAETIHDQTYFLDGRLLVWERADGVYVKFVWSDLPAEDPSILR
jgi:hypothetical protein